MDRITLKKELKGLAALQASLLDDNATLKKELAEARELLEKLEIRLLGDCCSLYTAEVQFGGDTHTAACLVTKIREILQREHGNE